MVTFDIPRSIKVIISHCGQRSGRFIMIVYDKWQATLVQNAFTFNSGSIRCISMCSLASMVYRSRRPIRVILLTPRLATAPPLEDRQYVAWSNDSRFKLFRIDGRVRLECKSLYVFFSDSFGPLHLVHSALCGWSLGSSARKLQLAFLGFYSSATVAVAMAPHFKNTISIDASNRAFSIFTLISLLANVRHALAASALAYAIEVAVVGLLETFEWHRTCVLVLGEGDSSVMMIEARHYCIFVCLSGNLT